MRRRVFVGLGLLALGTPLVVRYGWVVLSVVGLLALGWMRFIARVFPRVTVCWEGVATGLVCLALFTARLHAFLRWFQREVRPQAAPWPWRRTASVVAVVVVMFVAGIAATGVAHQCGWLLTAREPLATLRPGRGYYWNPGSVANLYEMGLAVLCRRENDDRMPSFPCDAQGRALHSWQTRALPYLMSGALTSELIDYDRPWDDPRNSAHFRGIVLTYLNPAVEPIRSSEGYGLSHYAGNVHVLGKPSVRLDGGAAGLSQMILAGEVADGFKPWGDPTNLRDPVRGMRGGAEGFGNPAQTGANMLFADGSVRFVSKTTNPEILGRLAVPGADPRRR